MTVVGNRITEDNPVHRHAGVIGNGDRAVLPVAAPTVRVPREDRVEFRGRVAIEVRKAVAVGRADRHLYLRGGSLVNGGAAQVEDRPAAIIANFDLAAGLVDRAAGDRDDAVVAVLREPEAAGVQHPGAHRERRRHGAAVVPERIHDAAYGQRRNGSQRVVHNQVSTRQIIPDRQIVDHIADAGNGQRAEAGDGQVVATGDGAAKGQRGAGSDRKGSASRPARYSN